MRQFTCLVALLATALAASAQTLEPRPVPVRTDLLPTPLPDNPVVFPPGPDVPPNVAAFSGAWVGKWGKDLDHTLVVERIEGRNVTLLYSWGVNASGREPRTPGYVRRQGVIDERGALRLELSSGAKVSYWRAGETRLHAQWSRDGRALEASMEKR